MKKLNYYTAIEEITNEKGETFKMMVSDDKEHDFTSRFKTIEDVKRAIDKIYRARQRKDITRTYPDGTKRRLSQADIEDIKYTIRKHYEEIEEIETAEHPRTFNEDKKVEQEEMSLII